ncbi:hypothetical protein JCM10213_000155 [Rhodosporidiobolus nylandii]
MDPLNVDASFSVTLSSVPRLAPVQLALAALRPDLDTLVRQKCFARFVALRETAQKGKGKGLAEPLFDLPPDFDLPFPLSLDTLSSTQLLLLQFNPKCPSASLAAEAGALFFRRSKERGLSSPLASDGRKDRDDLLSVTYELEGEGAWQRSGKMGLRVQGDALELVEEEEGEVELRLEANEMSRCCYLAGADDGNGAMSCVLVLELEGVTVSPVLTVDDVAVTLDLGMVKAADERFKALRAALKKWGKEEGFEVELRRIPRKKRSQASHAPTASSLPPSSPSQLAPSSPPHSTPPSTPCTTPYPSLSLPPPPQPGPWQYVSTDSSQAEWQAGFYARQIAFLESLAPYEVLPFPHFSDEELLLSSFAPAYDQLPPLPLPKVGVPPRRPLVPPERLALEYIFRGGRRLQIEETRTVLLTDYYPDLQLYARLLSKIILAKDALAEAYKSILNSRLYYRRNDSTTHDPIEEIIPLVEGLQQDLHMRLKYFTTDSRTLIRRSRFSSAKVGAGPARRFEEKLRKIVEYEDGVLGRNSGQY